MAKTEGLDKLQSDVASVTCLEDDLYSDLQSGRPILWRVGAVQSWQGPGREEQQSVL